MAGLSKDQVIELKATSEKFKAGEKVRITHLYVSGYAVIEHPSKKVARAILPDYDELVLADSLK